MFELIIFVTANDFQPSIEKVYRFLYSYQNASPPFEDKSSRLITPFLFKILLIGKIAYIIPVLYNPSRGIFSH